MKIRNGFVSNSSSSSFLIYGTNIGYGRDAKKCFANYIKKHPECLDNYFYWCNDPEAEKKRFKEAFANMTVEELLEDDEINDYISNNYWNVFEGNDDVGYYVGLSPEEGKDDETFAEFKERAKTKVKEMLDEDGVNLNWCSEAWYS